MRLRQLALWTVRGFLALLLIADGWLIGGLTYHALQGGRAGVRQWIGHLANQGGPAVWRERGDPVEIAVRSVQLAYENFITVCIFLIALTAFCLWAHSRLRTSSQR